ncbi:hypothetical protein C8238_05815, partial [Paracidovorax avenae]
GKMLTYAALVAACGSVQWVLLRGWRCLLNLVGGCARLWCKHRAPRTPLHARWLQPTRVGAARPA